MAKISEYTILEITKAILREHCVCEYCIGRQFAWLGTGTTNQDRGKSIFSVLLMMADHMIQNGKEDEGKELITLLAERGLFKQAISSARRNTIPLGTKKMCHLCAADTISIFEKVPEISKRIANETVDIEFETFLVGTVPNPMLVDREDELRGKYEIRFGETLKSHLNREIGKHTSKELKKEVDFDRPDVVFIYDMMKDEVKIQINPAFVFGRYRKLVRGIPQSRWDCKECNGKGCSVCNDTGRRYPDSISEYIGLPAQRIMEGSRFKVHAAGREDVDVLMLGSGRPFVVEVSEPKTRIPDLKELEWIINQEASGKIEVHELEIANRDRAQKIKGEASENVKEYIAQVKVESGLSDDVLREAEGALSGIIIEQRTPNRVSHRRSDLVREKQIIEVRLTRKDDDILEAFFKVQGGTYIKELISGDDGRTSPSLTSVLDKQCTCIELNVVAIYSHSPHHNA